MNNARFTLQQLADLVQGTVQGDPRLIVQGFNGVELAKPGEITFILQKKQLPSLQDCQASACIVPQGCTPANMSSIAVDIPNVAAARIHSLLMEKPFVANGIHATAIIGKNCHIPEQVSIGPYACLGDNVHLGERVQLKAGVVLEDEVQIGDDSTLHSNVTVASGCTIGKRVILHVGAVIGSDGFGFATDAQGKHYKKPQVGTVRIDDDVEIGANSCIDRAAFGTTWIKDGVRIDNLVMVGHNVVIGEGSILVAQTGIAGSTTLGRNVILGAKAGVSGHLTLGDGVMVAAKSGIHNDQPNGAIIGGTPAIEAKLWARSSSVFARLPEIYRELRKLRKDVEELQAAPLSKTPQP